MEDLNKTQIVLLCLLVSFVTSIGTGIITASLLREVPQNVTQTINRVVERTVETIVPQTQTPGVITREVTVVVKEEDLVIDAISKSRLSMVRLVQTDTLERRPTSAPIPTIGVIVKSNGTILADRNSINPEVTYSATLFSGGESFSVEAVKGGEGTDAIFLVPVSSGQVQSGRPARAFTPVLTNSDNPQLGQTVIASGGKEKDAVAIGRISSVNQIDSQVNSTSTKVVASIETDTPLRDGITGSILLNLNGAMIGFESSASSAKGLENIFTALSAIKAKSPAFFE